MNNPETDLDLDKLFLPAWAQQPATLNRYAKYEGEGEPRKGGRRYREDRRGPRRDAGAPPRRERPRPDRAQSPTRADRDEQRPPRPPRERDERRERRPEPPPLPEINAALEPDDKGVESMARQIKMTGRAYPLFQIAQLILQKPERHSVTFSVKKQADPDKSGLQPLFLCALDDTLWLSENEAVAYILDRHFSTFYQAERTAIEPPKGKYTFVAQCGLSGVVLGPPNHHDYQNQLRKLHAERFARMPFDVFKSRVKIVRDEAVVKKWVEEQSWRTEYVCLNVPEPQRFGSREAVEKHFREVHLANIVKPVESHTLSGAAARSLPCAPLRQLVRYAGEQQRRFPLQIATSLSQRFAARGLQFFKVNRTVTHVSVARPRYLDLEITPVSEGIRRIVQFINANPKCSRRQLIETLAPSPAQPEPTAPAPAPSGSESRLQAASGAKPPKGGTPNADSPAVAEPTPEQTAVIADLHWLIHQGHVIEFANGALDTAKKPAPRPPKPEAKPAEPEAATVTEAAPADATEPVGAADASPETLLTAVAAEGIPTQNETSGATPEPETPTSEVTSAAGVEAPVAAASLSPVPGTAEAQEEASVQSPAS